MHTSLGKLIRQRINDIAVSDMSLASKVMLMSEIKQDAESSDILIGSDKTKTLDLLQSVTAYLRTKAVAQAKADEAKKLNMEAEAIAKRVLTMTTPQAIARALDGASLEIKKLPALQDLINKRIVEVARKPTLADVLNLK